MTTLSPTRGQDTPRFGGLLWRLSRRTNALMRPLAGKPWNPIFASIIHRGRRSGRSYATPVAARRVGDGFVVSLAFGPQVDWYRNLIAAEGGTVRWRGRDYPVSAPDSIDASVGRAAFDPVQRFFLRLGRIDSYIALRDGAPASR
jgi:deazaflavin-dependent oxidoreductase (nitroreductase family)